MRESPSRYLLTGGGTAGHVYPALAFAEHIAQNDPGASFLYVGTRNGAEERIVPKWGYPLETLPVRGLPTRKAILPYLKFLFFLIVSTAQAGRLLLRFRPKAIIATGGYASAPVFLAAVLLRLLGSWKGVLALHEQNIIPGRFNLLMSRCADFVGVSFPETLRRFSGDKTAWTGYPIRKDVAGISLEDGARKKQERETLGIPQTSKVILVFGGSSGARTINDVVLKTLPKLLERDDIHIFHATGFRQGSYDPDQEIRDAAVSPDCRKAMGLRYRREPYFDHLESYYRIADLIVSRSGAGSVWEIAATRVPAILIPKAGLPGDHQVKNARFLERYGNASVLYEKFVPPAGPGDPPRVGVDADEYLQEVQTLLDPKTPTEPNKKPLQVPNGAERFGLLLHDSIKAIPLGDTMKRFGSEIPSAGGPAGSPVLIEWLPAVRLLSVLDEKQRRGETLPETDRRYLKSRIGQLVRSSKWEGRNLGVKLIGLVRDRDSLPLLTHFITDRTPAPLSQRILGGDFREVGFIRRNALQALWRLQTYDPRVRDTIIVALSDPYFEARSWAARCVSRLSKLIGSDTEIEALLRRNLKDSRFEVVAFSLEPLGKISVDTGILSDLIPLLEDRNWKVQEAAVQCLIQLLERGILQLPADTEAWMKSIPMRGLDFTPSFQLQKTWETFLRLRSRNSTSDKTSHPD